MTVLVPISARNANKLCSNCGKAGTLKKGRCLACYDYHHRTGEERPPWYGDGRARAVSDDAIREYHARYVAGEAVADLAEEAGVRAVTIYDYFRSLGLPLRLPKAKPTCSNCGRVCVELRKGRCNPCYQWNRLYNEERPLKENVRVALRRTRLAPDDAQAPLQLVVVDLDDDAVDLVVELAAPLLPPPAAFHDGVHVGQPGHIGVHLEAVRAQPLEGLPVRGELDPLGGPDPVAPHRERPRGGQRRIELPNRARRRVAGSDRAAESSPPPSCGGS